MDNQSGHINIKCTGNKISFIRPDPLINSKIKYYTGNAKIGPVNLNNYDSKRVMLVSHKNRPKKIGHVFFLTISALISLFTLSWQFVFSLLLCRMSSVSPTVLMNGSVAPCTCPSGMEPPDLLDPDPDPATELTSATIDLNHHFHIFSFRPENRKIILKIFKVDTFNFRSIKSYFLIYWFVGPGRLQLIKAPWVSFLKICEIFCMPIRIRRG
jgi:hypothetical protein